MRMEINNRLAGLPLQLLEVYMDSSEIDLYHVHPAYPLTFAAVGVLMAGAIMFYVYRADVKAHADVGAVQTETTSTAFIF
jgi:hypothetical protein